LGSKDIRGMVRVWVAGETLRFSCYTRATSERSSGVTRGSKNKKGRQFSQEKIGMTPSVAAPGDTNPSDATGAL